MKDIVAGIDVGTTKTCVLLGKEDAGTISIVSMGFSPSYGLRKGMIVDMERASQALKTALNEAGDAAGFSVVSAYAGIAAGHIKGFNGTSVIGVKGGVVTEEHVARLRDSATAVYVPVDREIIHIMPLGFRLDNCRWADNPIGMHCERIEANFYIVTGDLKHVRNLVRCCEGAGIEVAGVVLGPLASAASVLNDEEKAKGVVLVDMGGGTTDIAVYKDGVLRHTAVLAVGGNHITNDIAVGLGITAEEAERIKKMHGCALKGMIEGGDIEPSSATGNRLSIPERHLGTIIRMRCEEIMLLLREEMENLSGLAGDASLASYISMIVLTGGTAMLKGIDAIAENIAGLPVRIGVPEGAAGNFNVRHPEFAAATGLVQYGLEQVRGNNTLHSRDAIKQISVMDRMEYWTRGFLNKKNLIKGGSYV